MLSRDYSYFTKLIFARILFYYSPNMLREKEVFETSTLGACGLFFHNSVLICLLKARDASMTPGVISPISFSDYRSYLVKLRFLTLSSVS